MAFLPNKNELRQHGISEGGDLKEFLGDAGTATGDPWFWF